MVSSRKRSDLVQLMALVIGIVVLNIFSGSWFTRFDFTKEKRYTLSAVSRNLVDSLTQPVKVTVYLQGNDLPPAFRRLQSATRDMLSDMAAYSTRHLQFEFVDPLAGIAEDKKDEVIKDLQSKGVDVTNLSVKTDNGLTQKLVFPGALVTCGDKQIAVKLLQTRIGLSDEEQLNNSIQNLEYAFASAIKKASSAGKPAIGFTEGHGELTDLQLNDALKTLSDGFMVGRVDLKTIPFSSLMNVSLLVIPKPDKPFTELEKFKIDQYVMRGGKVLWTIDQVSAELDSLQSRRGQQQLAFPKQLNLDDQLFKYGVRINYDLIADMSAAEIPVAAGDVGGQTQMQLVPWLFYPILMPSSTHPLVKNLDGIRTEFPSTMDTLAVKGINKTILLQSSPFNRKLSAPHLLSLQMLEEVPDPKTFRSAPKTVGVLLEGSFPSVFLNRPVPDSLKEHVDVIAQSKPTRMIVISDGDIFKNQVASDGSAFPLGFDRYTQKTYGNKNLLLNIADYMTGDPALIALRNKEVQLRLLDKTRIRSEKLYWQVINNAVPIALVLIFAIFQHYTRKRKYAR